MVAGPGIAPGTGAYETPEILLLQPAIIRCRLRFSCRPYLSLHPVATFAYSLVVDQLPDSAYVCANGLLDTGSLSSIIRLYYDEESETWRSQGVTIPFFMRDRHACVHEHFETKILIVAPGRNLQVSLRDRGVGPYTL